MMRSSWREEKPNSKVWKHHMVAETRKLVLYLLYFETICLMVGVGKVLKQDGDDED